VLLLLKGLRELLVPCNVHLSFCPSFFFEGGRRGGIRFFISALLYFKLVTGVGSFSPLLGVRKKLYIW